MLLILLVALLTLGAAVPAAAQPVVSREVRVLAIDGVINPYTARYLERELETVDGVAAVVLRLDTPGGLEPSMRRMVEAMLSARVPVIVHVAPPGARAASAGMFIVIAGHVAAMASGTNIGAAHPVTVGGRQADTTVIEKMASDAAAFARAIAERHERNVEWVELAVLRSVSITAQQALAQNVIDLVVDDLDDLLAQIDGRTVETAAGAITLETADVQVVERRMSLPERILHAIADPNIAYLLLTIGFIGIIAELYNPGSIFPGATGVVSLILAFVALGSLPVNWAGVVLILLGIGFFVADLSTEGIGMLAVGGVIAFLLGSLMLYSPFTTPPSPAMPAMRVNPFVIAAVTAGMSAFLVFVGRAVLRTRHSPVAIGAPALVGRTGVAASALTPRGTVRLDTEVWTAVAEGTESIAAGEPVEITGLEGVVLRVRRAARGVS